MKERRSFLKKKRRREEQGKYKKERVLIGEKEGQVE